MPFSVLPAIDVSEGRLALLTADGPAPTDEQVETLRALGASRVVVASAALADEEAVTEIIERSRPGETVLGIEVVDGRIHARGAAVDLELASTLGWLRTAGAERLLVTAVDRVATVEGPDTALVRRA